MKKKKKQERTTEEPNEWLAARLEADRKAALNKADAGGLAIILRTPCVYVGERVGEEEIALPVLPGS